MRTLFGDTFLWIALVNTRDARHAQVRAFLNGFDGRTVTTDWVLVEVADALAGSPAGRQRFIRLRADLLADPDVTVVESRPELMEQAVQLYADRDDKRWSLTDCLSFVVMQREGLTEALTGDHHFEQAGFVALLK